jgi:hypothetical protein
MAAAPYYRKYAWRFLMPETATAIYFGMGGVMECVQTAIGSLLFAALVAAIPAKAAPEPLMPDVVRQNVNADAQSTTNRRPPERVAITAAGSNQCYAIEDSGGSGNGATANNAAWAAVMAKIGSASGCVSFGPGTFLFTTGVMKSLGYYQNIRIVGAGKDITTLRFTGTGGGITLARGVGSTFTVSDLTFTTTLNGGGPALDIIDGTGRCGAGGKSTSLVANVAFRGADGIGVSNYWDYGIRATNVNLLDVINVDIFGNASHIPTGIMYQGTPATSCLAVVLNIWGSYFQSLSAGIVYGSWAQGVTVAQSNFNESAIGIIVPSGELELAQLTVTGNQFNVSLDAISVQNNIAWVQISNNLFLVPAKHSGVYLANGWLYSITGNTFTGVPGTRGGNGVAVYGNNGGQPNVSTIVGNTYSHLVNGNYFGSTLASGWNVQSNAYQDVQNPNNMVGGCTNCKIGGGSP